jgi:hypothetical protein
MTSTPSFRPGLPYWAIFPLLGDFLPTGRLLVLRSFFKQLQKVAQILGLCFLNGKTWPLFFLMCGSSRFWAIFYKLTLFAIYMFTIFVPFFPFLLFIKNIFYTLLRVEPTSILFWGKPDGRCATPTGKKLLIFPVFVVLNYSDIWGETIDNLWTWGALGYRSPPAAPKTSASIKIYQRNHSPRQWGRPGSLSHWPQKKFFRVTGQKATHSCQTCSQSYD